MTDHGVDKQQLDGVVFRTLGKLSVGIVVTREGVVAYCNEAFSSMTAIDGDALIGQLHPFLLGASVPKGDLRQLNAYLENPGTATSVRLRYAREDGLSAWNEVQLHEDGPFITWIHRDITQQIATHELWQRYEFLLNTSQQFMALINRKHAYDLVSRSFAAAFGTTPDEVNGSSASTVWGNATFDALVAPYLIQCFEGEEVRVAHWVDLPVGGRRCLDMVYTPYETEADGVLHAVFVAWDVTKEKRAADAVKGANRLLEQHVEDRTAALRDTMRELEAFNYTIAHDLRSPLRVLKSFAQMLEDSFGGTPEDAGYYYLSMITQGVAEMQHMIDRLLDFSRLGREPLSLQSCSLDDVVNDARQTVFLGRKVQVNVAGLPHCQGDPALLKLVFVNLLQNAEKFSRSRKTPTVQLTNEATETGMLRICICDNGIGFPMSQAEAIFTPFKQVHEMEENTGSGLGLAIARRIVERHNGRVWGESTEGHGAKFYVELPIGSTATRVDHDS